MKVIVDFVGHDARDPLPLRVETSGGTTRALDPYEAYAIAAWWNARDKIKGQGRKSPAVAEGLKLSENMLTYQEEALS